MTPRDRRPLAFSIDFEGFTEALEESVPIAARHPRFAIADELRRNADRCLELLARHRVRATFFVLGWIAEAHPELVREIARAGHEIGSHFQFHRRLGAYTAGEFGALLRRSKSALEDAAGVAIEGFRAPDFSLAADSPLLAEIAAAGFRYDASLNPTTLHDVYGDARVPPGIHHPRPDLIEFPVATCALLGQRFTVGGGGYFRLFPWWLTRWALARNAHPTCYLHPYEIGGVYPRDLALRPLRRLRHTWANGRLDRKLERLFTVFSARPVGAYLRAGGWLD